MKLYLCLVFALFLSCFNSVKTTQKSNNYILSNDTAEDISISYFNEDKLNS